MSDIEVGDLSFAVLAGFAEQNNSKPVMKATTNALLALDTYQRPYVWSDEDNKQLLLDLREYINGESQNDYYMGALLLHKKQINNEHQITENSEENKSFLYVIDGQQRLSSLAVLYHVLFDELPQNIAFRYYENQSIEHLQQAHFCYDNLLDSNVQARADLKAVFERIVFSVIVVGSEDLAFTFFDTQNNRGVPLATTDLLKAFHLRAIKGNDKLQKECDYYWQGLQALGEQSIDFAPLLFEQYLWRARNWRGSEVRLYQNQEAKRKILRSAFEATTLPAKENSSKPGGECTLYPCFANTNAAHLIWQSDSCFELALHNKIMSNEAESLPFSIRQPIDQGLGFFLYARKYSTLLHNLLYGENLGNKYTLYRNFYRDVQSQQQFYLRQFFTLCSLMFLDKFGVEKLLSFALWLDHLLGGIRLSQSSIRKETPVRVLRDTERNLLDEIANAYCPEEVIGFLTCMEKATSKFWRDLKLDSEELNNGVRGYYKKALTEYYFSNDRHIPNELKFKGNILQQSKPKKEETND